MADWVDAAGGVLGGLGALAAAFVAVFSIRRQEAASKRALEYQARATNDTQSHARQLARDERTHSRQLAQDERLWERRVDLYSRITHAMRDHLELPTDGAGAEIHAGEVPVLAALASEAEIVASREANDIFQQYVYDSGSTEDRIDRWADFTILARQELVGGFPPREGN